MHKVKQTNIIFFNLICITVCTILILVYVLFARNSTNLKTEQTSLLNKKYLPLIDSIIIEDPLTNEKIELINNNFWQGRIETKEETFPLRLSIPIMLEELSKTRKVQLVSNSINSWASYELLPEQALSICFQNSKTGEIYSKVYFGIENFSGSNIYFRTDKSTVYQTRNDFSKYLTASNYWADTALIPSYLGFTENTIQRIIVTTEDSKKTILEKDSEPFSSFVNRMLLSTGKPVSYGLLNPVTIITIENGDGSEITLNIYFDSASDLYYVYHNLSFTYALEISAWSYDRLLETLY